MHSIGLHVLFIILVILIVISGFFSGSETGMMSLNRYRLRHMARKKHKSASRVEKLLRRPDRLLGVILIGNTFANILASAVATVIAVRLYGDIGVIIGSILLTLVILIFSEITPKTIAAIYPEKIAFFSSYLLNGLLKLLYPLVWTANMITNNLLKLFHIHVKPSVVEALTREELRTVVHESASSITPGYQDMLLSILDLSSVTVNHIMVPRNEIVGIDITQNWDEVLEQLKTTQHTKLPVYRESIEHVEGILHARNAMHLLADKALNQKMLLSSLSETYFIPEATPLNVQLINFRQKRRRLGLVVDEYGDILGLVTLEDILEEIVGEFTTGLTTLGKQVKSVKDGSHLIAGAVSIRELNRMLSWELPVTGAKTLSGLIVEQLQMLPQVGICLKVAGYPIEIIAVKGNTVNVARIWAKQ